ncbi:acyl carrier protein [Micromonospora sp. NPDC092111]|uniref:acyl carrier protein n=1 Tax=Micromonospora sp. NPDC092111 TaxID=3364289 RepID=UPI00383030A8
MSDRQKIVDTITAHLQSVLSGAGDGAIAEDRDLRDFPDFDSLGILETLVWLESTFEVTIPDEELVVDRFDSVGKMADYVLGKAA